MTAKPSKEHSRLRSSALYACFAFSGLAGLVYQTAWTREFALVFGTSEIAVAVVLAAYMAGLALGARLIEGLLPRLGSPVRAYALLEAGIAVAAVLLVPLLLRAADAGLVGLFGHQPDLPGTYAAGRTAFELVAAFVTLLLPTTLMGASLPVLVSDGVHSEREIGTRTGALYAWNTAGAVCGALLTALVLLPRFGLRGTQWSAGALNLFVSLVALLLIRTRRTTASDQPKVAPTASPGRLRWILPLMAASGAVSFVHEVLWTRLLQRSVGSSVTAFGVMVASFLLGIALGGAVGARLASSRAGALRCWVLAQLIVGVAAAAAWYALLAWAKATGPFWERVLFSAAVLLPLTFAVGLTYPLAVRVLARDVADAARASARVYAWNTTGAILGALLGGFVLIPALRYEGTLALVVSLSLLLALAGLLAMKIQWRWWAAPAIVVLTVALLFRPGPPASLLHLSPVRTVTGPLLYYGVGRSADVVVVSEPYALTLLGNGLPEAAIARSGEVTPLSVESWMSALAVLARPDIHDLLIVGFGGGNAVAAVPPSVSSIDVVELEPQVLSANRSIAALRSGDPFLDRRVHVVLNDARSALALTERRYDAIISQPSHPWTAGASHLYTREFLEQAHAHLRAGGVLAQWMDAEFLDPPLLRSLLATLHSVFPHVRLYRVTSTALLLLASDLPLDTEQHPERVRGVLDSARLHFARLGLAAPENLVAALALDDAGVAQLAAGAELISDNHNLLATSGLQERGRGLTAAQLAQLLAPYDPLTNPQSFVHKAVSGELSFDFIGRGLMAQEQADAGDQARLERLIEALPEGDEREYLKYEDAMHALHRDQATEILVQGLRRWPASPLLEYAQVEPYLDEFSANHPSAAALAAAGRLGGDGALVLRGVRLAAAQDWQALAQLDRALAELGLTAPWGLQAAQLRVEWRAHVASPELRQRYGDEALAIIDGIIPQQPTTLWFALRALNAVGTNRPEVELESIAGFTRAANEQLATADSAGRAQLQQRASALVPLLDSLESAHLDPERVAFVHEGYRALLMRLQ